MHCNTQWFDQILYMYSHFYCYPDLQYNSECHYSVKKMVVHKQKIFMEVRSELVTVGERGKAERRGVQGS